MTVVMINMLTVSNNVSQLLVHAVNLRTAGSDLQHHNDVLQEALPSRLDQWVSH